ncbi:hypothetical protein UCRPA7_5327 [Phaeoacremonium minimum UCRPA7]|uniref:Uncharacterized protein n=1 Tax=Phaeoacremonium minimum (strain UCR-PA7) TaxID=1286976 RepID=R8BIH8_PHAM7|nr:hypothetical protein UCRPA7_5327 [Phaeoacremonium minimum UCRPA7]EON99116.1 hypothetical protein UCRPA7_5327 [Phaeoacremonium minimum UCRPA7]
MATTTATTPVLQSGKWDRRAGRYDFKRFDHASSTAVSIANETIGKVTVDIKFLFRRSQWGTLGQDENPAGILYMDLNFTQPVGHKLTSATIQVTLDDDDVALDHYRDPALLDSGRPVQITEWYGPKQFGGPTKMAHKQRTINLTPEANVLGNGGGGLGVNFNKSFVHTSKWTFQGSLHPGPTGPSWAYRRLKWDMTENDLEKHPDHANKVHTAFAFENSGQPFLMKVQIDGELEKIGSRLKDKVKKKFGPRPRKEQDISSTLVGAFYGRRRPLDELAKGLERAMELENRNSVPLEMPASQQATFQQLPYEPAASNNPATVGSSAAPGGMLASNPPPQIQIEDGEPIGLLEDRSLSADRTEPTLDNLARVGDFFSMPIRRQPPVRRDIVREDVSEISEFTSATTLVNSHVGEGDQEEEEQEAESEPERAVQIKNKKQQKVTNSNKLNDQEAMAKAFEVAFVRVFVQCVMYLMSLWEAATSTKSYDEEYDDDDEVDDEDDEEEGEEHLPKPRTKPKSKPKPKLKQKQIHSKQGSHVGSVIKTTPVKKKVARRRRVSDASE